MGCFFGYLNLLTASEKGLNKESWIKGSTGKEIHLGAFWSSKEKKWMKAPLEKDVPGGIAIYPILRDWDNDGDLDLIIGSRSGTIGLRINEGDKNKAVFSDKNIYLKVAGKPIILPQQVSIDFVDLNNDTLPDLVCAENSGKITWCKNEGTKTQPKFTTSQTIFDANSDKKSKKVPVHYLALAVRDQNGDNKPDILVGAKDRKHQSHYWILIQK